MQTYKFTILVTIKGDFYPTHREEFTGTINGAAQRVKTLRTAFGKGFKAEAVLWQGQR